MFIRLIALVSTASTAVASNILTLSHQSVSPSTYVSAQISCLSSEEAHLSLVEFKNLPHDGLYEQQSGGNITDPRLSKAAELNWDFDPICTQVLDHINAPLCIYTSSRFASGRGLSIFSQPSKADKLLEVLAFRHPELLKSDTINDDTQRPWEVKALPGRGMGMIATRDIEFGEVITAYTPVFVATRDVGTLITGLDLEYLFSLAVNQLPERSRDLLLNLARSFDRDDYKIQDIVATNSFEFDIDGDMHMAIYPETARLNHDCGPNSQYHINNTLLTHTVRTARKVTAGTELSIAYSMPLVSHETRHGNLNQVFHFDCTCSRCSQQAKSDRILTRVQYLESSLSSFSTGSTAMSSKSVPKFTQELIDLYEEDHLEAMLMRPYGLAAQAYAAIRDAKNAKKYAKLAIQYGLLMHGEESEDVRKMRILESAPERHESWWVRSEL